MMLRYIYIIFFTLSLSVFSYSQKEISLDGQWEIIFDERNEGRTANWMKADVFDQHTDQQYIQVPSAWELSKKDYEGVAFYKKIFEVPRNWAGKVIRLQFGAVNYLSEVWVNDKAVGFHEGGFTPFEFRVDEMIQAGATNVLTIRVVGPIVRSDKRVDGIGKMETAQWRSGLTAGIWQNVKLVATGEAYINDVYIQPNIEDNTAQFHISLNHIGVTESDVTISLNIMNPRQPDKKIVQSRKRWALHPGENEDSWMVKIPNAKYWSPDNPHLYTAEVEVKYHNAVLDTWRKRFGMRAFTIKNEGFYLNGQRIYIKATFFEGLYPNGIAYPDSEAMMRQEIKLAKEAGFNMIRPWRRPPVPKWLDLADEMGILVVGSPALECMTLPLSTPYLPKRVAYEIKQTVLRDRNRACIVQWELFNQLHRPVLKQLIHPMVTLTRKLDPTRLILDESGSWDYRANMYLPNEYEPTKFNDIHYYPGPFVNRFHYDGLLSIGLTATEKHTKGYRGSGVGQNIIPNLLSYVSELGYGSLPDLTINNSQFEKTGNSLTPAYRYHKRLAIEQSQMLKDCGFEHLYPNMQQFYLDQQQVHGTANKRMLEAARMNPTIDGYCIHGLVAGGGVLGAGLLDLWRNPKSYAYEATKAANQPRIVSIRMSSRNVYAQKGTTLEVIGINDLEGKEVSLVVEIIDQNGKSVYRKISTTNWPQGVAPLFQSDLSTKNWQGTYSVKVRVVTTDGHFLTENSYPFDVFQEKALQLPKTEIALLDMDNPLTTFLKDKNIALTSFSDATPLTIPVFVTNVYPKTTAAKQQFAELFKFIRKGGTAVYLDPLVEKQEIKADHPAFPFTAKVKPAQGLWTCIPHYIRQHPVFEDLPANTLMRDIYENVWAKTTLCDLKIKAVPTPSPLVATIAFDCFSENRKMDYTGPGASWWGSDMALLPYGKGQLLISQLRLMENFGNDPVADLILGNILRFL